MVARSLPRFAVSAAAILYLLGRPALAADPVARGNFRAGGPVGPDGQRATADLPPSQHIKNTGGIGPDGPGSGAGLCVFTSVEIASRWQQVTALIGLQKYMTEREGGGYPEKLARVITAYCRERNRPVPAFVQHTGGDERFLELALKTGRLPCVTYAGQDDFYRGRVAHMVCLAHLDERSAAIVDNNRPGVWVWMGRAEFLRRWRDMQGGWAFVLLAPPPPPYAARPAAVAVVATVPGAAEAPAGYPTPWATAPAAGQWSRHVTSGDWHYWAGGRCTYVLRADGHCYRADAAGNPTAERCPRPDSPAAAATPADANYGIEMPKLTREKRYWLGEAEVSREAAVETFEAELRDDSDRWSLTVVDTSYKMIANAVDALPAAVRSRLHVQCYAPGRWEAEQFGLRPGVTIRKAAEGRVGADAGHLSPDQFDAAEFPAWVEDTLAARRPRPGPFRPFVSPVVPGWLVGAIAGLVLALLLTKGSK